MPELPEVETIRRQLFKEVVGKRIKSVEIKLPKMVYFDGRRSDVKNFKKSLEGGRGTKDNRAGTPGPNPVSPFPTNGRTRSFISPTAQNFISTTCANSAILN